MTPSKGPSINDVASLEGGRGWVKLTIWGDMRGVGGQRKSNIVTSRLTDYDFFIILPPFGNFPHSFGLSPLECAFPVVYGYF